VACQEGGCGKATANREDWTDAITDAKEQGYQFDECGIVYCGDCAERELERQEEERLEEEGDDRYATRSDD